MGQEAQCRLRFGKKVTQGKALLESTELLFRGDTTLTIPFQEITAVEVAKGWLTVQSARGAAAFELGPAAEKWALKIRYPRPLIDKLGVKPGSKVAVVGEFPESFLAELKARAGKVVTPKAGAELDLVFVRMAMKSDTAKLKALQKAIRSNGAIWVVWPKGRKEFREDEVRAAGPSAGLVDVKVVSFSDTLSGLKLVIPLALRPD